MRFLKLIGFKPIFVIVLFLLPQALLAQDEGVNVVNSAKDTLIQVNDAGVSVPLGVSASRVSRSFRVHGGATREEDVTYFSVSTAGNVGIGTDNPSAALHVTGGNSFFQGMSSSDTLMNVGDTGINVSLGDGSNRVSRSFRVHGGATRAGDTFFSINENGNVGVGTDNPAAAFHVTGGSSLFEGASVGDTLMNVNDDGVNIALSEGRVSRSFRVHGGATRSTASLFSVNSSGFIGIGTDDPLELLDIDGGGINIGRTDRENPGTMRWTGEDFEGFDGGQWRSFTATGSGSELWQTNAHGVHYTGGKVGIGTPYPYLQLTVQGDGIGLLNQSGNPRAVIGAFADGEFEMGYLSLYGAHNRETIVMTTNSANTNTGYIAVMDSNYNYGAVMYTEDSGAGLFATHGPNRSVNTWIGSHYDNPDFGFIGVENAQGWDQVELKVSPVPDQTATGVGELALYGPNGSRNVLLGNFGKRPDNGLVGVFDEFGVEQAAICVNDNGLGEIYGDVLNVPIGSGFRANSEIVYSSTVGPEATIFIRGTAQLINGRATLILPDHFRSAADENRLTVQLTPLSADSKGLAVVQKSLGGIMIRELLAGIGNYAFDWEVKCVRKDQLNFQVEREKSASRTASPQRSPRRVAVPTEIPKPYLE